MTEVKLARDGDTYEITIEGHADYSKGVDIVCSAVSVLSFTLMQALKNEDDAGNMTGFRFCYSSGGVTIRMTPIPLFRDRIETIVDTVMAGFALLAEQYPENVVSAG